MNRARSLSGLIVVGFVCGCVGDQPANPAVESSGASSLTRDIRHTRLAVDLASQRATAVIDLAPAASGARSVFEVGGLEIDQVSSDTGTVAWSVSAGRLEVETPSASGRATQLCIDYRFRRQDGFTGLMSSGATFVWPYFCGNLFPCHSSPADGSGFELTISGTPAGQTTVHANRIGTAPAYQLAWATGPYQRLELGATAAGTRLAVYALAGGEQAAIAGTAQLVRTMDWYEQTFGPYPFGAQAGAVAVDWNGGYGGMEHHPYWHVAATAMHDPLIHAHEAAHGWIGAGVRIACWEDFALSEGTASYLAARAREQVAGQAEGERVWAGYDARLRAAMRGAAPKIARPEGCGRVDILKDGLYSDIPYMKGAFFWRALELRIGRGALDRALGAFLHRHRHQAATFTQALTDIAASSGYDATTCADAWLRREAVPTTPACQ